MVDRIENGQGRASDLDMLDSVAGDIMGRTICALGDAAALAHGDFARHRSIFSNKTTLFHPARVTRVPARAPRTDGRTPAAASPTSVVSTMRWRETE
jgi:NADH-quinone oxidoreductase subunit F